jgi:hypothetical protein
MATVGIAVCTSTSCAAQVCSCPVNCLTFNHLGSQVFAGDAAGILHELAVDLSAVGSATVRAAAAATATTCSLSQQPTCDSHASLHQSGSSPPAAEAPAPAAVHSCEGQLPTADSWKRGSTRPCPPAGGMDDGSCLLLQYLQCHSLIRINQTASSHA